MNKILILGFNGMLGTMVSEYFEDLHEFEVYKTSRRIDSSNLDDKIYKFDVSQDSLENLIEVTKPNYVINCIGVIKPDIDEKNINSVKAAININSYFPLQIASLSKDLILNIFKLEQIVYFQVNVEIMMNLPSKMHQMFMEKQKLEEKRKTIISI